jgi:O-antigen ligase
VCVVATLAWGAGAFGAIYVWAYVPLIAATATLGAVGLIFGRGPVPRSLVVGLALVGLAVSLQLIPFSAERLASLSPHALEIHRQRDLAAAVGAAESFPLSIDPAQTRLGLLFLAAFALLVTGTARMLTRYSARQLAASLAVVGVALSIVGLAQRATFNGKIYGFWELSQGGAPFGPFINRNHFAGWMLMVVPLTVGLFASVVSRAMAGVRPQWRNRILWFATPDANKAILAAFAVMMMALALVATLSRSGISAFAAAMIFASIVMVTRRSTRRHRNRWIVPGYLALVCIVVMSWVGVDRIAARFGSPPSVNAEGRRAIWADTWHMVNDFALTGTGLNTFGSAALFYQTSLKGSHMREAHNDYLQVAAEGGVLAGVPIVLSVAALITGIRRRLRDDVGSIWWIRMGAVSGLLAIAAQSFVEFSLQMPGNAALFAVLCGIALHDGGRAASQPLPDALALGLVEPPLPALAASENVVSISKGHRPLHFSFDEQSPHAPDSRRNFEPALLDDAEDRRQPMARRDVRPAPRTARVAAPGRLLAGVVALLSLLLFLLMILGIVRS